MRRVAAAVALLVLAGMGWAPAPSGARTTAAEPRGRLRLVGHDPLFARGMNAALAVHGDYAYVGSRTDGTHPHAGVLVVDVSRPRAPEVVHEIGPPAAGNVGETSRELRVWPEKDLLIVLNLASNCSPLIHACSPTSAAGEDVIRFFDISGRRARRPKLVSEYVPSEPPHEFFLWDDPERRGRALLFMSTPGGGRNQLLVTDVSHARRGHFEELGKWSAVIPNPDTDNRLHSLSVSNDGTRAYLAYLGGGFFVVDTSDFARGVRRPEVRTVTPVPQRVHWGNPGAHSAVKLPGRPYVLVTDEVYGKLGGVLAEHGCPWGWARIVDIDDVRRPEVVAHYKIRANHRDFCDSPETNPPDRENFSSWSSHNPTVTDHLAVVTWHSGGVQVISTRRPRHPRQAAEFVPEPLPAVVTEDPALSAGRDKVVMWSYPIVEDGLVYVVDVRNGLYVLRYRGPYESELSGARFLEGNSNLGDARR